MIFHFEVVAIYVFVHVLQIENETVRAVTFLSDKNARNVLIIARFTLLIAPSNNSLLMQSCMDALSLADQQVFLNICCLG